MFNKFNSIQESQGKAQRLHLDFKKQKENSGIKKTSSSLNTTIKIQGTKAIVNGKTIVVKTSFNQSGYNKNTGKVVTKNQIGMHSANNIDYINREDRNKDIEEDSDLSNIYDGEKQLSNEELKNIKEELAQDGTPAFRRIIVSTGHEMSRDEMIDIVRNTMQRFQEETGKSFDDYHFAVHTNTDNVHAHININGSKSAINWSNEQLQMFKIISAEETKKALDERDSSHNIDRQIERENNHLINIRINTNIREELAQEIKREKQLENMDLKISFSEFCKDMFDKKDLETLNEIQKAQGKISFIERQEDNLSAENVEKTRYFNAKIESLRENLSDKDIEAKLDTLISKFSESNEAKSIHQEHTDERLQLTKHYANKLEKETGWTGQEEKLLEKELQSNSIKFTKNSALDSLIKDTDSLTKERDQIKNTKHEDVSESQASEIAKMQESSFKRLPNNSLPDDESLKNIGQRIANQRNILKSEGNEESEAFRVKQREFMNLKMVENGGLDIAGLQAWKDYATDQEGKLKASLEGKEYVKPNNRNVLSEESADQFIKNNVFHAEQLQKAGILDKEFKFKDERAREILFQYRDEDFKTIAQHNINDFKQQLQSFKQENKFEDNHNMKQNASRMKQ